MIDSMTVHHGQSDPDGSGCPLHIPLRETERASRSEEIPALVNGHVLRDAPRYRPRDLLISCSRSIAHSLPGEIFNTFWTISSAWSYFLRLWSATASALRVGIWRGLTLWERAKTLVHFRG